MRIVIGILAIAIAVCAYVTFSRRAPVVRIQPPPGEEFESATELPKLFEVPEFSLTERSGRPVTRDDLKGRVWVADFFYTSCPGPCPIVSGSLSEIQKALGQEDGVRLVSISTDPEKDSPETLSAYARRFNAGDHWFFLTGDKSEIFKLANEGFRLGVTEDPKGADPIVHSTNLALVDQSGIVRGYYGGADRQKMAQLLRDVHRLLEVRK